MSSPRLYTIRVRNDGTEHPDWQADGEVEFNISCVAQSEEEARSAVREKYRSDLGWEILWSAATGYSLRPVCGYYTEAMTRPCQNRVPAPGLTCYIKTHTRPEAEA